MAPGVIYLEEEKGFRALPIKQHRLRIVMANHLLPSLREPMIGAYFKILSQQPTSDSSELILTLIRGLQKQIVSYLRYRSRWAMARTSKYGLNSQLEINPELIMTLTS